MAYDFRRRSFTKRSPSSSKRNRLGWTRVELVKVSNDTLEWFDDNCQGEYRYHRDTFIFENPKDALIAKLMIGEV